MPDKTPDDVVQSALSVLEAERTKPFEVAIGLTLDVLSMTVELAEAVAAIANSKIGVDNPELAEHLRFKMGRIAKISRATLSKMRELSPNLEKGAPK